MPPHTDQAPSTGSPLARWFLEEVQPHEPALRAYLQSRFPTMHDVDDVVQESYVQVLRKQPEGRIASVRAYLFTIAHHAVLRVFRRRKVFSDTPVSELPPWRLLDGAPDAAEVAHARQREALVAEAVVRLPARCRAVFKLRLGRGLSHAEIAAELGLSEATVRVQVARGLQKCAQFVHERIREEQR